MHEEEYTTDDFNLLLVYCRCPGADEILRAIESLQLTAKRRVTPANWNDGDEVMIAGSVSDEEARRIYPEGWTAPKPYIRWCRSHAEAAAGSCGGRSPIPPTGARLPRRGLRGKMVLSILPRRSP